MKWFVKCIRNYVNFSGRARRAEYWYFYLFSLIFLVIATLLDRWVIGFQLLSTLLSLFLILPQIAVLVRRLHDTNRSGKIVLWYYVAALVWLLLLVVTGASSLVGMIQGSVAAAPIGFLVVLGIGGLVFLVWGILFLVWCCQAGTAGDNKYGPDPKAEIAE